MPWTMERAAHEVPFYRRHWKDAWRKVKTAKDLRQLPVLRKEDAVAQQHALLASSCGVGSYAGVISSGERQVCTVLPATTTIMVTFCINLLICDLLSPIGYLRPAVHGNQRRRRRNVRASPG